MRLTGILPIMLAALAAASCGRRGSQEVPPALRARLLVDDIEEAIRAHDQRAIDDGMLKLNKLGTRGVATLGFLLDSPDPRVVEAGVELLSARGRESALAAVVEDAVGALPPTHTAVGPGLNRLVRLGTLAVPYLAGLLTPDLPADSRSELVSLAARYPSQGSADVIEKGLLDQSPAVRATAASALGALRPPNALERLRTLLKASTAEERAGAIAGLVSLEDPAAVADLLEVLKEPDQQIPPGENNPPIRVSTLHDKAAEAIDVLTKMPFNGNISLIQEWLDEHR
ncbi:MAG: HEAT repeat domain-containing protein [Deltaproteobacteria bacterium]|nr:HEAT repeat domain-containing protein [Deltaproteobacteria bacterium]